MPALKKPKLKTVLVRWFIFAGIVGLFISFTISFLITYHSIKDYAFLNLTSSRDQQVLLIDDWFQKKGQEIKQLAVSDAVKKKDLSGIKTLFKDYSVIKKDFENCFFIGKDGWVIIDIGKENTPLYVGELEFFKMALQGEDAVDTVVIDRKNGVPVTVFSSPVYSENEEFIGMVFGTLSLDTIDRLISSFRFGETGKTYLIDKSGAILTKSSLVPLTDTEVDSDSAKYLLNAGAALTEEVVKGETGFGEYRNFKGVSVLAAYRWLPQRNWGLVVEIEKMEILGDWITKGAIVLLLLMVTIALVVLPLAKRLTEKIVTPLINITEKMRIFAENHKSDTLSWIALESPVYQELAIMNESFYRMGEKMGQLMNTLETQAQFDFLTGLANRSHFFKRGEQLIELIQRNERACSLIFLDIDSFKKINDTYGHSSGDQVLVQLARILEKNIRISDVAGRLGGEEFTVILPDTDMEGAKMLAERLRRYVETTPINIGENNLHITVSIGVAIYYGSGVRIDVQEVLDTLIKKADTAMYRAKLKGRNRVEMYYGDLDNKNQMKFFLDETDDVL